MKCNWCQQETQLRKQGHGKRFCSDGCRYDFHRAIRIWGIEQFKAGVVPIGVLHDIHRTRCLEKDDVSENER